MTAIFLSLFLFNQVPLLNESFTGETFPPAGWDTLRSDTTMTSWYRYNYATAIPDAYQARVRVYDWANPQRAGWSTLKTPAVNMAAAAGQESLFFWYRFSIAANNLGPDDTMYVDISNNDLDWTNLLKIGPGADTNVWQTARIDLAAFDDLTAARFRFHYMDQPNDLMGTSNCNFWLDSVQVLNYDTIPETVVLNELFVDPQTYDHNNNSNLTDEDEEFIEVYNKAGSAIAIGNYQLRDAGGSTLTMPSGYSIPDDGYLVCYASGEFYIVDAAVDTVAAGSWLGTWPLLDNTGDTIRLYDNTLYELDAKGYVPADVIPDRSISRMPDGGFAWVNNAHPTPGFDNSTQYTWPIAEAFRDLDSNYVPDLLDSTVTITGVVTAPPGIYSTSEAYIQDATAGVCLFGSFPAPLQYGDSVIATGTVAQYNGKSELADLAYTLIGSGTLPEPIDVNGSVFNTEYYEGSLVRVKIAHFYGFLLEGNYSYTAVDTLGNEFTVWIDSYTNIPGHYAASDTFTLTGIKGQYTSSVPPNDGYQLMPRDTSDFSHFYSPETLTIAEAFRDLDSNYVPDLLNSGVTIAGVVTAPPGIYSADEAYIQDSTGGICLYGDYPVTLHYGDSIVATGTVDQYRGKSELTDFAYAVVMNNATVPEPIEVNGQQMNTEQYEGCLVRIRVRNIDGFLLEGNHSYDAWDTLNYGFTVWIDSYTNIPGSFAPTDTFTLTGIKGQYSYATIPNDGYQFMPRHVDDFSHFYTPVVTTIGEVQKPGPDGASSQYADMVVTVEGVVTGPNYVFTTGNPSFYIQDSTGGINIYNVTGDSDFLQHIDSLGARLRIAGTVTEYRGLTEVASGYGWFLGMDTVPQPKPVLPGWVLTEGMESFLVQLTGVIVTTPYQTGDGYNMDVLNGDAGITVRFTNSSGINPLTIPKDVPRVLTGIVGQYDPEAPFTTGYQLLLRFPADIVDPQQDTSSAEPVLEIMTHKTFIPSAGEQAQININSPYDHRLELDIHDMSGRVVRRLYSGAGGPNTLYWNGKDDLARPCRVGIYLLNLKASDPAGGLTHRRALIVIGAQTRGTAIPFVH